ncbi:5-formyltetrahydrofolate cyclo-ligase family, putative [Trypanosoma equiperdum]|uniref:5-formyltetrahydrofolate cyclo-ligase n=2 Tax=Trypanozoon TaxID=39700 RepID=Q57W74_TRYB2|nr:hypothetical protein, conserved [Trypanosoma brucei brucei TREU927]AAX70145.1 hypothetical protein, conserved [Trypanosoma brucei]AAZ13064.1 hypothetical protein, conserved [Trypanosoma brucei brucei TREU927]SCU66102.1 5-formyltetrahydrofolate cyclo-ligase family, putative [Trypanosoma equiperdum]
MYPLSAISDAKKVLRLTHMRRLRAMARSDPSALKLESIRICEVLYERICVLRRKHLGVEGAMLPPLLLCAYLPLFYEVDLRPLLSRLWRERPNEHLRCVSVFVPTVLAQFKNVNSCTGTSVPVPLRSFPPQTVAERLMSAMLFVEVLGEGDLLRSFDVRGCYGLMELKEGILHRDIFRSGESVTCGVSPSSRRVIACDWWHSLFPHCPRPAGLIESGDHPRGGVQRGPLLSLTPGVLFDRTGGRLGKGGGYYDRFLQFQRCASGDPAEETTLAWGVAREMQLLSGEGDKLPVYRDSLPSHGMKDALMDAVVTSTEFVKCS